MSSIRARVKPALLVWARNSMNLSVEAAAKKLSVSAERLRQWEIGEAAPTITQLRNAGRVYKRPLAVFYLSEPPKMFDALRDYRRGEDHPVTASPELTYEIRQAHARRELFLELASELEIKVPEIQADLRELYGDAQRFGSDVRNLLGVTIEEQKAWGDPRIALNRWIHTFERLGVLVFRTSDVEINEMRGFSIYRPTLPVIVANGKDSYRGQIFTLLHEFTHILLRQSPLCDEQEYRTPKTDEQRVEVFCNQVAGEVLVPRYEIEREVGDHGASTIATEDFIGRLADAFSVSREVVARRLLSLGKITIDTYREKRDSYLRAYAQQKAQQEGFAPPYTLAVRDLGKLFVRTVVDAYRQETITSAELSGYLNLRLKHLPKVEQAVYSGGEA